MDGGPCDPARWAEFSAQPPLPLMVVVAAALVDPDNRILIARRPAGKMLAGLWEFPGGKVEPNESPEAALVRELREELGIETSPGCLYPSSFVSHRYDKFHLLMPLYVLRNWQGNPTAHEHSALAWVKPGGLRDYPMPPADAPLIQALIDQLGPS